VNLTRLRTAATTTAASARQALTLMILASTARRDLVQRIRCGTCGTWVRPGRYHPRHHACTRCSAALAAVARKAIRERDHEHTHNSKLAGTAQ
jgi:hypothetical protein